MEDDPWNLWSGSPSGGKWSFWSNLALALAYSDEYVWVWSEHTHYAHGFQSGRGVNPFLAALSNQTFNTGKESVATFTEDFASDPMLHGWYFDFDMLDIGRKKEPAHEVALMSTEAVPYIWSKEDRAVILQGSWRAGAQNPTPARLGRQRRRFVRPIQPLRPEKSFRAELDIRIASFGQNPKNPMILGLFHSEQPIDRQSCTLQIGAPKAVKVVVAGAGKSWTSRLSLPDGLKTDTPYRLVLAYEATTRRLRVSIKHTGEPTGVAYVESVLPATVGAFQFDELGVAQWDGGEADPPQAGDDYRYRLERAGLHR